MKSIKYKYLYSSLIQQFLLEIKYLWYCVRNVPVVTGKHLVAVGLMTALIWGSTLAMCLTLHVLDAQSGTGGLKACVAIAIFVQSLFLILWSDAYTSEWRHGRSTVEEKISRGAEKQKKAKIGTQKSSISQFAVNKGVTLNKQKWRLLNIKQD